MSFRPQVSVITTTGEVSKKQVVVPSCLVAPIRPDIVNAVHTAVRKNARQAYAVSPGAGHQHSAVSWGTGRAVSRIPRVSGGGTSRSGQAAFGNMCRKGRMFAPTKTYRKWQVKVNQNQKRYATVSALAASAIPALVQARGHRISNVNEVPLVVDNSVENVTKTSQAVAVLKAIGAFDDCERAQKRTLRCGKGKMRANRRFTSRTGPLIVYAGNGDVARAFRNIPGVEVACVDRLNLLQLAPGGHMGRFIVWSESAFQKLNSVWGSEKRESASKKGYFIPRSMMTNSDVNSIINSQAIQEVVRPVKRNVRHHTRQKKNPLRNNKAMAQLNPYAMVMKRSEIMSNQRRAAEKASRKAAIAAGKAAPKTAFVKAVQKGQKIHRSIKAANYARLTAE